MVARPSTAITVRRSSIDLTIAFQDACRAAATNDQRDDEHDTPPGTGLPVPSGLLSRQVWPSDVCRPAGAARSRPVRPCACGRRRNPRRNRKLRLTVPARVRNRRGLAEAITGRRNVALLVCDLDHFKRVNDRFGHDLGDRVLIRFGELLRDLARDTDIPMRLGGEEFCVVLPNTSRDGALRAAERLRRETARELRRSSPVGSRSRSASRSPQTDRPTSGRCWPQPTEAVRGEGGRPRPHRAGRQSEPGAGRRTRRQRRLTLTGRVPWGRWARCGCGCSRRCGCGGRSRSSSAWR